ncbi:MAG TPA: MFS transporter [Ktedonobacteraceae bacterium]
MQGQSEQAGNGSGEHMVQSLEAQSVSQRHIPRIHCVLAFITFILIGCNDGAFGVLIPGMRAFYHVDAVTISWLFLTLVFGYLCASFNTGLLTARLGVRRFLLVSLATFSLGALLFSLGLPYAFFLCASTITGFAVGMIDAGLNAYIASLPNNGKLLNYLHAFYGVGALFGPLLASALLVRHLGWQATYVVWLGLAFLLLLGMGLAFKPSEQSTRLRQADTQGEQEREVGETEEAGEDRQAGSSLLSAALRRRGVWLAASFLLFYVGTEVSLGNWGYSYLTLERSGPALLSAWVISGYWCGLTLGRLTLANLLPRLGMQRLITLCLAGVALGLILAWVLPGIWGVASALCLVGFCLGPLFPTAIAFMPRLVAPRLLPSAIGFLACFGSGGAALFPWLAGNLVQHLGYWSLLPFALILTLLMWGVWLFLSRAPEESRDGQT